MRKWKKLAVWAIVLAMVATMLPGVTLINAEAATVTPTLSEIYPEATDLMTNGGFMNNSEKAWTDLITVEEINSLIDTLLYDSLAQYSWAHPLFAQGETVSGTALIAKALVYLGWNADLQAQWTAYFHLELGLKDYDASAALTREQAAQILLNILRANPNYNPDGIKASDTLLGLSYVKVSSDGLGRPSYQWQRGGEAVTAVYAAAPLAVLDGTGTWRQLMAASGLTEAVSNTLLNAGYWQQRVYGFRLIDEGIENLSGMVYYGNGWDSNAMNVSGWVMEVYDTFSMPAVTDSGNEFRPRTYEVVRYCDYLSCINDADQITAYIVPGGYGPWDGQPGVAEAAPGYYTMAWSNKTTTVQNLAKAKTISGALTAFDENTVTVGETVLKRSTAFNTVGTDLLTNDNLNKIFTFYLSTLDYLLGIKACEHSTWSAWEQAEPGTHVRYCSDCTLKQSEACTAGAAQSAGADGHVKACSVCHAVLETEEHTLGGWVYVDESVCKQVCGGGCGYERTLAHDTEVRNSKPSSMIETGYTGDTYCRNCGALLATGTVIPKVDHDHVAGEPVRENEVAPDCENPGSYDEVIYCTFPDCGEKISTNHVIVEKLNHIPGEAVKENEVAPGCEVGGSYDEVTYCTREGCGDKLSSVHKELAPTDHRWKETGREEPAAGKKGFVTYTCENDPSHTRTDELPALLPELTVETNYPEAVELMINTGLMDGENTDWKAKLTGAEANRVLQALYDGPGFINSWSPDFAADGGVSGKDFISDLLVTIGWNYGNDTLFGAYNHLEKGLRSDYSAMGALTREQAAQMVLNTLKAIPTYNTGVIKANDPGLGLTLVKVSEDEMGRPSYKWQQNGGDMTHVYADQPIATVAGGSSWNAILDALSFIRDDGVAAAEFRWKCDGGTPEGPVSKKNDDTAFLTEDWTLEIYSDYSTEHVGFEYLIVATTEAELPEPTEPTEPIFDVDTDYREAVELMINTGLMDGTNENWKEKLTGAEANRVLQALYDGPGFVDSWSPAFAANAKVTGKNFISGLLVTIGWNYNNDALFGVYNHLEKGLRSGYSANAALTREQAAQMVLNTLKAIPTYNNETIKANDPGLGLVLVEVSRDSYGRPSYKWQKDGKDITHVYRDTPVVAMQAGLLWTDILSEVGDVGDINIAQRFRWNEEGGKFTAFVSRQHPDYDVFLTQDWAMEVYLDYTPGATTYQYSIVTYEGEVSVPPTGDTAGFAAALFALCAVSMAVLTVKRKKFTN